MQKREANKTKPTQNKKTKIGFLAVRDRCSYNYYYFGSLGSVIFVLLLILLLAFKCCARPLKKGLLRTVSNAKYESLRWVAGCCVCRCVVFECQAFEVF